jgi:alcohol dehydrogenase
VAALPTALAEPHHAHARERLAVASTTMGYNLSCVGTCLPHRLDKPLCAHFPQIAHGQAIAYFYPAWAAASWKGCPDCFARITALLDPATASWSSDKAAAACADRLTAFIEQIGLSRKPSSLGIELTEETFAALAERVRGDLQVNPVPVDPTGVIDYYRSALT